MTNGNSLLVLPAQLSPTDPQNLHGFSLHSWPAFFLVDRKHVLEVLARELVVALLIPEDCQITHNSLGGFGLSGRVIIAHRLIRETVVILVEDLF